MWVTAHRCWAIETPIHNEKKNRVSKKEEKRGRTGAERSPSMNVEDGRREALKSIER